MVEDREFFRESNAIEDVHSEEALEDSLAAWRYLRQHDELSHVIVRETHRRLMTNRQPEIAGEYRDCPVSVGSHDPPSPAVVRMKMEELLQLRPATASEAVRWHVAFETIHPFQDGNGRIGRMIYYWHCYQLDVEPELWTAEDREEYYELFEQQRAEATEYVEQST